MSLVARSLRAYRATFLLGILCLVVTTGLSLSIPWILKDAIESLRAAAGGGTVARDAIAIAAIALVMAIFRTASRLCILGAARRVVADLRERLFAHLLALPASFYARHRTGDIMSRAVNDLILVRSFFGPGVLNVADVALRYTAGIALMVLIDPLLTLAAVLPYPFLLYGVARVSRTIHARSNAAQEQLAEISHKAQENLSGINMVKAYGREAAEIEAFADLSREYRRRSLDLARSRGFIVTLMGILGGLSTVAALGLGARHVIDGRLTLGGLVAFISYLALLTGPTIMMGWVLGVFQRGLGAMDRIEEILSERSDLPADHAVALVPPLEGAVSIQALDFAYPDDGPGRAVLRGIDLEVPAGTTVAIVGPVGSGKTTLVRLIAGLHPAADGRIRIDGRDLNAIPTARLRAHLGMVPQETFLFSRSIAANVALGRPAAPRAAIEEAARVAQLARDLADLPQGLDTMVGERGVTLSGGQRQRVALARALLVDPRILILDDALSSVDADTEEAILRGLRGLLRDRTTFLISHRASTALTADRVVVLEEGRIVEDGPPRDLLERDGPFSRMHRRQQIERELERL